MLRATIVGGAGYVGGELLRLLLDHPEVRVTQVSSERLGGRPVESAHPQLRGHTELRFVARDRLEPADVVFTALPHGEAAAAADGLLALAPLLVDLSADFRLRDRTAYPTWYGWEHPAPALLADFVYALPEIDRDRVRRATRLSSGGCVATAAILGLLPLVRAGVVDPALPLVVGAVVGSSAAGAQPGPASHHPHRSGEIRSFAPTGHRHTAEIVQELGAVGEVGPVALSVTAVEAVRGILVTAQVFLNTDLDERAVRAIYREAFAAEPFLRVVARSTGIHRFPNTQLLTGTNFCDVGFERDPHTRRLVVLSAIDNLTKGAAGQAVQALNVHCGFPETTALSFAGLYPL